VLIVGDNEAGYGGGPPGGRPLKQQLLEELAGQLDLERIHFLGRIPYPSLIGILQASWVHVYLSYPFVLSWSLLEAMSIGCAIVASNTPPLREAITDHHTGRLVDFFSPQQIAQTVSDLLDRPDTREELGSHARAFAIAHYDLRSVCLGRQTDWVHALAQQ